MPDLTTEKWSVLKEIDRSDITLEETVVHAQQTLNTGSEGIQSISYVSGSIKNNYWQSLHNLFYLSGSTTISHSGEAQKYSSPNYSLGLNNPYNPQFRNKFHGYPSGSIITIPQRYFGEEIKVGSFKITDTQDSKDVIIVDDKYGNLYSTNAEHSQSANTSISSSENYIGNIFYDMGIAVITETGSWSGSVNYPQVTSASNFNLEFRSTQTIYTREYNVKINPTDFNYTLNTTARCFLSGSESYTDISKVIENPYLCSEFTGSEWQPYITTILFHRKINEEPLFIARLPKPLRKSDLINMNIKVRLDM